MKLSLICVVLGENGSTFDVEIDDGERGMQMQEAIKKENECDYKELDVKNLHLFSAKKTDGAWLDWAGANNAVTLDRQGNPVGFEQMDPSLPLKNARNFGEDFRPKDGQVHVLVKVSYPNKRRRLGDFTSYDTVEQLEDVPQIDMEGVNYVTLPGPFLEKCGLRTNGDLMIFCRPQVHELWRFLKDEVIAKGKRGFVVGPPGTGKSVGVLSFAASLGREEWDVVWIHLSGAARKPICVDLGAKLWWEISDRKTFELPRAGNKKRFVCLDGLKDTPEDDDFFADIFSDLRAEDKFVTCASLATVRKTNEEDDFVNKIEYFTLHSWTKQEYVEAIADPDFYDTVAAKFDATSACDVNEEDGDNDEALSEDDKKYRALGLKFYYGGGSCRFMFQHPTKVVIQTLTATADRTVVKDKLFTYCSCAYDDSPINKLYGSQAAKHKKYGERFPVSSFAASLLAEETSEDAIEVLAISVNTRANPAVAGRLFEWLFFASISNRQVRLFDYDGVVDKLPQARVVRFDPTKRFKRFNTMGLRSSTILDRIGCGEGEEVKAEQKLRIAGDQLWLRPVVWDQGCYDAVYFDTEEGGVIFVQVAHLDKQDVKVCYINEVLDKLKLAGMEIFTVEIVLVATPDRYGEVLGRRVQVLNDVDVCEIRSKEIHVKVRAFEGAPVYTNYR